MSAFRLAFNCFIILAAGALSLPGIFRLETPSERGFARAMRSFAITALIFGLRTVFLQLPWSISHVSPAILERLRKLKIIIGGVALGIVIALGMSGQFTAYYRTMRQRKPKPLHVKPISP
jgi:hypothetical protein